MTGPPVIEVSVNSNGNAFKVGQSAVFTCKAKGRPDMTNVQWRKSNVVLTSQRDGVPDGYVLLIYKGSAFGFHDSFGIC